MASGTNVSPNVIIGRTVAAILRSGHRPSVEAAKIALPGLRDAEVAAALAVSRAAVPTAPSRDVIPPTIGHYDLPYGLPSWAETWRSLPPAPSPHYGSWRDRADAHRLAWCDAMGPRMAAAVAAAEALPAEWQEGAMGDWSYPAAGKPRQTTFGRDEAIRKCRAAHDVVVAYRAAVEAHVAWASRSDVIEAQAALAAARQIHDSACRAASAARAASTAPGDVDVRAEVRVVLGVWRLSPAAAAEVDRVKALIGNRGIRTAPDVLVARERIIRDARLTAEPPRGLPVVIVERMLHRAAKRIESDVLEAYRSAGYRSATHSHDASVACRTGGLAACRADSESGQASPRSVGLPNAYAKRAFSVATSSHQLTVSPTWRRDVHDAGLAVVDGMLTLGARPASGLPDAWEATWARQSKGTSLVTERGVIVLHEGRLTHARSLEHARKLRSTADLQIARAEKERRKAEEVTRRRAGLEAWTERELETRLTLDVSVQAGNCESGTLDWAHRHLPDTDVVAGRTTVRTVLQAAFASGDRVDFAVKACLVGVRRQRKTA